jgi:heme-degrading monooxygenase HmoA
VFDRELREQAGDGGYQYLSTRSEEDHMETVITRVTLHDGAENEWDAVMRDRMAAAEASQGWLGGSILKPEEDGGVRVILGVWETRAAWEEWHRDSVFKETAERLAGLERDAGDGSWYEVLYAGGRLHA